jgi:hypothetical protein
MRRIRDTLILFVAVAAMLAFAQVAMASPQQVIRDCAQDGKLNHHYSLSDLKKAEKQLPTDVDEYTNCRDVINQAEVQGSGGHSHGSSNGPLGGAGGGSGGGGGPTASPSDVKALNNAKGGGKAPSLTLHGEKVVPGTGGVFKTAGAANSVPMPVLLALIAIGALTAGGGVLALRRRFPEVFGAALRLLRR